MPIAPPSMGIEEGICFLGWETTYGTAVTSIDAWLRPMQNTLRRRDEVIPFNGTSNSYARFRYTGTNRTNRIANGYKRISGLWSAEVDYDDIGLFLSSAIAHPVSTAHTGGDTGAFTHLMTAPEAAVTTMPNSWTGQAVDGIQDVRFTGCMVDRLAIHGAPDRIVYFEADIIAQDTTDTDDALGTISGAPFAEFHDSVLRKDVAGTAPNSGDNQVAGKEPTAWTWEIRNNLVVRGTAAALTGASTKKNVIREPVYGGERVISMSFDADYFDTTYRTMIHNDQATNSSVGAFAINVDSGVTIAGTKTFGVTFEILRGLVLGDLPEYSGGAGIKSQRVRIEAVASGNNLGTVSLVNGTTNAAGAAYLGSQS